MYVSKPALKNASQLEQGDLLLDFLLPDAPGARSFYKRSIGSVTSQILLPTARIDAEPLTQLEVVVQLQPALVLVVGNTCDMSGGGHISVVPTAPLSWTSWKETQRRATSGVWSKSFYLGAQLSLSIPRSEALLPRIATFDAGYVQRLLESGGTQRLGGLNEDGVMHLRWALGYCFGRNSRHEPNWVTDDDLLLLLEEAHTATKPKAKEELRDVLEWAVPEAKRRGLTHPLMTSTG